MNATVPWTCPPINTPLLAGVDFATAAVLISSGIGFFYYVDRGLGWAPRPHGVDGPSEENSLSGLVACGSGVVVREARGEQGNANLCCARNCPYSPLDLPPFTS